jgi:predicted DNA-binding transcriptional regulator AlpA
MDIAGRSTTTAHARLFRERWWSPTDQVRKQAIRSGEAIVLTPREAAARLGMSPSRLKFLRRVGRGPAYLRLGRRLIRYLVDDVNDWLAADESRGR